MAPNIVEVQSDEGYVPEEILHRDLKTDKNYKPRILWPQLIFHLTMHLFAIYGEYLLLFHARWATIAWGFLLGFLTGEAVVIGAHRGYSHVSYKPSRSMEIALLTFQTMAGQNSTYTWARDHRIHHKFSDTDADPHNINRGFWFAHIGWLITSKHPMVIEKGRKIDVSDLRANKLVMFQHRYYIPIYLVVGLLIPILIPVYGWNESLWNSFFVAYCLRYVMVLNLTWCVNSVAHTFGTKPYDKRIHAVQSGFVWLTTFGDGWHNFHHSFPWDYRSSEAGRFGMSTWFIDFFARHGYFYDLKTASPDIIQGHGKRHGDGSQAIADDDDPHGISTILRILTHNVI